MLVALGAPGPHHVLPDVSDPCAIGKATLLPVPLGGAGRELDAYNPFGPLVAIFPGGRQSQWVAVVRLQTTQAGRGVRPRKVLGEETSSRIFLGRVMDAGR